MTTVLVNAFCERDLPGSPQYLHFFRHRTDAETYRGTAPVHDSFDHSYVWPEQSGIGVAWANSAGPIALCGSGAYALVWFAHSYAGIQELQLEAGAQTLRSAVSNQRCSLVLPERPVKAGKPACGCEVAVASGQGIFLVELSEVAALSDTRFVQKLVTELGPRDVHALCLYFWNTEQESGELRYFVPRYGRSEDYVTGSIQRLLTPWVAHRHGPSRQVWRQSSARPGLVNTQLVMGADGSREVMISGSCEIDRSSDGVTLGWFFSQLSPLAGGQ